MPELAWTFAVTHYFGRIVPACVALRKCGRWLSSCSRPLMASEVTVAMKEALFALEDVPARITSNSLDPSADISSIADLKWMDPLEHTDGRGTMTATPSPGAVLAPEIEAVVIAGASRELRSSDGPLGWRLARSSGEHLAPR